MMKKILLIGKNGQLGSALMNDAPLYGFEIISFERKELDVTDEHQVQQGIEKTQCDILVNASAYHVLMDCEKNPEEAMCVNFTSVVRMARICKEYRIPFVSYSTCYVFDGEGTTPYTEKDPPHPLQMYSISKLAGEYGADAAYPDGAIMIRTGALYGGGAHGSPEKGGNFVLDIMREAEKKPTIEVSCEQIINPTFAGDLSKATLALLQKSAPAGMYHLVNEGYCGYDQFAQEILAMTGSTTKVTPVDRKGQSGGLRRPRFAALRNTKAAAMGVILPPWQKGLMSYIQSLT